MTSVAPEFSIVIPTIGRQSLRGSVLSVLGQSHEDLELIVVNDRDGVGSERVLSGIDDPRLRLVTSQGHRGVSAARNVGIGVSRGEWVAFLDDDDLARPNWLETWRELIQPGTAVVTGRIQYVGSGARMHTVDCKLSPSDPTTSGCVLLAGGFAVRKDLLLAIGGYDERLRYSENTDLGLRLTDLLLTLPDSQVVHAPETSVDVRVSSERGRATRYAHAQGEAVEILLERHSVRFAREPRAQAALLRVLSRSCRLSGDRRGAVMAACKACRLDWGELRNWRVLAAALLPSVERVRSRVVSGDAAEPSLGCDGNG